MPMHRDRRATLPRTKIGPPLRGCAVQSRGSVAALAGAMSPCCTPRLATGLHSAIKVDQSPVSRVSGGGLMEKQMNKYLIALIIALSTPVSAQAKDETLVLAGGCFWGMEAVFEHVKGVKSVVSGYAGGRAGDANYDAVSAEQTSHAEAVRIVYDPAQVSLGDLFKVYFTVAHDPTQVDRQTPDVGRSYRSAVFPQNEAQRVFVQSFIATLNKSGAYSKPIATRIETGKFYPAEAYHQDFMRRNPNHPYILAWDVAKVAKLKKTWPGLYKGK
jgi:peptide-methionine (S)-S-oxide reductase